MKKNVITGLIVVITLVVFVFGLNFLKGKNLFVRENTFYAVYEHVDGLKNASKVTIRGMKVGEVSKVQFTNNKAEKLVVAFSVSKDYDIPVGTIAQIVSSDIMGSRSLELRLPMNAREEYLMSGDTLEGRMSRGLKEEVSAQVRPLKAKAQELMLSIDSILIAARTILREDTQRSILTSIKSMSQTFQNLEKSTGSLNQIMTSEQQDIQTIIKNISEITSNINKNKEKFDKILGHISSFTDTLSQSNFTETFLEAQIAVQEFTAIMKQMKAGEGTIGALLNDKDLYNSMESAVVSLERLATDLRLNPKKYVSFSLLNTGRTVYYDSPQNKDAQTYTIQLYHSSEKIDLSNPIFKGNKEVVEEKMSKGKGYLYTIGSTSNYNEIQKKLKEIRRDFPGAFIINE